MVDEEGLPAFAGGQMGGLTGLHSEFLEVFVTEADQHPAPIVIPRKPPDGGAENVVFAAARSEKAAAKLFASRKTLLRSM
jgi:hypothetical protein